MTRRATLTDVCSQHRHAYKIGSECSQCWADRRRKESDRSEDIQHRKAHPQRRSALPVDSVTKRDSEGNA